METVLVVFLLLQLTVPALGVYKRWLQSTNFNSPNNWNAGRAPCGNDVVLIPDESPVVYVQTNTTLKELILPDNGEVIFGKNSILAFTSASDPNCAPFDGDVEYVVSAPHKWVNPDNWCPTDTENGPCSSMPLLDSERVPCATDDAVFPRDEAFYVDLDTGLDINVKSLKLSGRSYTTTTFTNYIQSPDGQRIFPPPKGTGGTRSSVTVSRQKCNDPTGCTCGNDQGEIFKKICSVFSQKCPRAQCRIPFRPMGSCCDVCGAMFNGTAGTGFRIATFKTILQQFISARNDNATVKLIVSKTGMGFIQAVLTGDNGDTSIPVAETIKSDMDADARTGGHKYRLDGIQLMESSGAIQPTSGPNAHTGGQLGGGSIAGIIIALIVVLVLALFGLLFFRKRTGRSNNMLDDVMDIPSRVRRSLPRGRRVPGDVSRPRYEIEMTDPGFGNPLYGDIGGVMVDDVRPMEMMPAEIQPTFDTTDDGFNNPLYASVTQDGTFVGKGNKSSGKHSKDEQGPDSNI
ncbi:protein amnionless-like [Haliotis asinina]|uniref:protein amnionless-like n=1 Tax=Haliotis asinina TaxID=109174 RepID=UPI003531A94B